MDGNSFSKDFSNHSVPTWFCFTEKKTSGTYQGKRWLDIAGSIIILVLSIPLSILLALLIFISSGRPVIFKQKRLIPGGKEFVVFKFRSMKNGTEKVTWIGKIMRPHRLDELPQLWNVLKGNMSLIGPRPMSNKEAESYYKEVKLPPSATAGITGLAQIANKWSKRPSLQDIGYYIFLNNTYTENCCPYNDLCILLSTIFVCISGKSE